MKKIDSKKTAFCPKMVLVWIGSIALSTATVSLAGTFDQDPMTALVKATFNQANNIAMEQLTGTSWNCDRFEAIRGVLSSNEPKVDFFKWQLSSAGSLINTGSSNATTFIQQPYGLAGTFKEPHAMSKTSTERTWILRMSKTGNLVAEETGTFQSKRLQRLFSHPSHANPSTRVFSYLFCEKAN